MYLDYFYDFTDVCTKPDGNVQDLKIVNELFNLTYQITSLKQMLNDTMDQVLDLDQYNFGIDISYVLVRLAGGRCHSPAHGRC